MEERPTDAELFAALYATLAAEGRGRALFGAAREGAARFFDRSLVSGAFPVLYFEFPLKGEPGLDLLAIYEQLPEGARFALGGGYGYQKTFEWFCGLDDAQKAAVGLELDLSQGATEQAGVYFQQRGRLELLESFLATVGQQERAAAYLRVQRSMPKGWQAAYVGLFPGREGSPMRLGGYLSKPVHRLCASDPAFLAARLAQIGFTGYGDTMLERCATLMGMVPGIDFQFDVGLDGSLQESFGLSLSFGRCRLREVEACFSQGYGAQVMEALQGWGLADERWRLIPQLPFARGVTYTDHDGQARRLALCVRLNYAKVKFVGGVAQAAKFYLAATVEEIVR